MREIALFVEDYAHRQVIGTLVERIAAEYGVSIRLNWRNAVGGYGKVVGKLKDYIRDIERQGSPWPDLLVVATDANCKGLNRRAQEVRSQARWSRDKPMLILAIPDPHIERWLLLDGAAFRAVFGTGCDAPDQKCARSRYKERLIEAIKATETVPRLGGIEYADEIVRHMEIDRVASVDRSFQRFITDLRNAFRGLPD